MTEINTDKISHWDGYMPNITDHVSGIISRSFGLFSLMFNALTTMAE